MFNSYQSLIDDVFKYTNSICGMCFTECVSNYTLHLPKCGHIYHLQCFLMKTLENPPVCPKCLVSYNETILSGHNNIETRVVVKNYKHEYRLGLSHYINYERKGYSFVITIFKPKYPLFAEIKVKNTKILSEVLSKSNTIFYSSSKPEDRLKLRNPGDLWHFYSYTLNPKIKEYDVKGIVVEVIPSDQLVISGKILLHGGLESYEFPGENEMETLFRELPTRTFYNIQKPFLSRDKLLN